MNGKSMGFVLRDVPEECTYPTVAVIGSMVNIIGFGSLLSEKSARSTFGHHLRHFRLARVKNYRRVFVHPASIFFQRGIARPESKVEIASLSTEPCQGCSFTISVFEIPEEQLPDFYAREEEFNIVSVEFEEENGRVNFGLMCCRWTDEEYIKARGQNEFDRLYGAYGLTTIWGFGEDSGILPCRVYLRHCLLAVQKLGEAIYDDFINNTFLGDRRTSLKTYIAQNPSIMQELPPLHLADRYSGWTEPHSFTHQCDKVAVMTMVKILGYGSLLSETSVRSTFGVTMKNFRLGRVHNYRRVFSLPGSLFFREKIANLATKEIGGLCVEPSAGSSFIVSIFEVPEEQLPAFYQRELLYDVQNVEYEEHDGTKDKALMCLRWTDEGLVEKHGQAFFDEKYRAHGLETVWGWGPESGILPCRVYLRHCLLSVEKLGEVESRIDISDAVYNDFVENSFLGDRKTTIKEYITKHPEIMDARPPPSLIGRYSG
ncbi:hypothetical protein THRCLA_11419 [Thraustotheca clavata]|uniref:Uncharacterized protein n=1 Tax=Thraustotheca clavata TaxID=74557 RepID=A0A1V9Y7S3_9STRA|nr:hypothetical protein THRCLA_11419 [Thraustotheca clavata]